MFFVIPSRLQREEDVWGGKSRGVYIRIVEMAWMCRPRSRCTK
jgi:hypothetical protein